MFVDDFVVQLDGKLKEKDIEIVSKELTQFINNYEITKRETSLSTDVNYIPECYKKFMVVKSIEGLTEMTLKQYRFQLEHFFQSEKKPLTQIRTDDVLLYLYEKQKTINATSADNIRRIINSFFQWATDNQYITINPCKSISKIKGERHLRTSLSEAQLEKVRDGIIKRQTKYKRKDLPIRDKALFEFMYSTGARVSEIVNCNVTDVDLTEDTVTIFGKGKKQRETYLNAKAKYYLVQYLTMRKDSNTALFVSVNQPHKRLTVDSVRKAISKYSDAAGTKIYPHKIRHTTATLGLKHGMSLVDLQKLLGHDKPETTLIYAERANEDVKHNHKKYIV